MAEQATAKARKKADEAVPDAPAEEPAQAVVEEEEETRVDEFAVEVFRSALGYEGRLPDKLVVLYNEFKRRKDSMQPGRMSPEGFAFVDLLAAITDSRLKL